MIKFAGNERVRKKIPRSYPRIDLSSTIFDQKDLRWLGEAWDLLDQHGFSFGIQVHNSAADEELEMAANAGFMLSFHLPVQGRYMLNFAAEDTSKSWDIIKEQYELMVQYSVCRTVFHGFLMTDKDICAFGHGKSYYDCMNAARRIELLRSPVSNFVRDFTNTDEFLMRRERLKENLERLRFEYGEYHWCIENDFPAITSGMLRGSDMAYLKHELCFDTGHMWATSKMLDLDFYEELNTALESECVEMIHLHASKYTFDMPHDQWGDGHLPLTYPNSAIDLKKVVQMCKNAGVGHFVLECGTTQLEDIKLFLRYYFED